MYSPRHSAGSDDPLALATSLILDRTHGPSTQHAINSWESEGGTAAVARDPGLAPCASADLPGWRADNTIGWFADHRSQKLPDSGIFDHGTMPPGEEDRILQCLGAALILQWNTMPTKLQRELQAGALRARIARCLHPIPRHPAGKSATVKL